VTAALALHDVRFRWPGRTSFGLTVPAFGLDPGESVLLIGESGSGKSTLLSLICGIVTADAGRVAVEGIDISTLRPGVRDRFRAERIGVIFQQFNLLPYAVGDPMVVAHGLASFTHHDDQPFRVAGVLAKTGTPLDRRGHFPMSLDTDPADWSGSATCSTPSASDEMVGRWVENPYWQHFCGFDTRLCLGRSSARSRA
jgi:ABC-type ATPase involved in cell division